VFRALAELAPGTAGEIQLSDALARVVAEGGRVLAVPLSDGERRHDVGTLESYCAAFLEYALGDHRFGAELRARATALLVDLQKTLHPEMTLPEGPLDDERG
jgi:UTP--glucose-1-phosphate uridylyltransferase